MSRLNKRIQFTLLARPNGRGPSNFPLDASGIPMRITRLFPMRLKDVTIRSLENTRKESDVCCIQEMMTLFDCMEKHDFDKELCIDQAKTLEKCYASHMIAKSQSKAKRKEAMGVSHKTH